MKSVVPMKSVTPIVSIQWVLASHLSAGLVVPVSVVVTALAALVCVRGERVHGSGARRALVGHRGGPVHLGVRFAKDLVRNVLFLVGVGFILSVSKKRQFFNIK